MSGLPPIPALQPVTIPAVAEQVYNRWYLTHLRVDATNPMVATAIAEFHLAGTDANGATVVHPTCPPKFERIENIFIDAQTDPLLAQVMGGIILVCANLREDTERCEIAGPHASSATQQAGFAASNRQAAEQALAVAQAAKDAGDTEGLAAAKADAAAAALGAANSVTTAKSAQANVVTAAGGKTFKKITALVAQVAAAVTQAQADATAAQAAADAAAAL